MRRNTGTFAILTFLLTNMVYANNGPVVIAGNGLPGFAGDGGPATKAQFFQSSFITGDNAGNIYISDTGNHRIRKIDSNGVITTIAGNGTWGKSGDGGPATEAQLNNPRGLAVDSAGNLYIVGSSSHRIRKVDPSGTISTAVNGESYLNSMSGLALDNAGNLYISDTGNSKIRKIEPNGNVTTIAGNGQRTYSGDNGPATEAGIGPQGITLDSQGNIYIAETNNFRVRKIDTNGIITTFAGRGNAFDEPTDSLATSAIVFAPNDLAFDSVGNLYIADVNGIRKVDPLGIISTAIRSPVTGAFGIFIDASDNLFILDPPNNVVWRVADISRITTSVPLATAGTQIRFAPQTLSFDIPPSRQTPDLTLTITNDSLATNDLTIRQISLTSLVRRFELSPANVPPQVLEPGERFDITVSLLSAHLGDAHNHIRILSSDPTQPILYVPLTAQEQKDTDNGSLPPPTIPQGGTDSTAERSTISPSGHFMIHYTVSGSNAVDSTDADQNRIPDYVDEVAQAYDHVRTIIVDSLGYRPPPSDGDEFYDIQILNLGPQISYGLTVAGIFPALTTHSRIQIDNDFTDAIFFTRGLSGMRVTAANTFFTAVLYGYYAHQNSAWWQFLSGTWIEDVLYDDINDYYQYLNCSFPGCFFHTPTQSFNQGSFSLHPFGASIFGHYLTQTYGFGTMRKIWETLNTRMPETFTIKDLEASLPDGGFAKILPEFVIWNYFTGSRARAGYYDEASSYPEMPVNESFPSGSGTIDHLAADYIRLNTQERTGNLTTTFDLDSTAVWTLKVLLIESDSVDILTPTESTVKIADISRYQEIVFIPVITSLEGQKFAYAYIMTIEESTQQSTPNPDFSGNNKVDFEDFLLFVQHFDKHENQEGYDSKFDLNQDKQIGFQDFLIFASAFNTTTETNSLIEAGATLPTRITNTFSASKPAIYPNQ